MSIAWFNKWDKVYSSQSNRDFFEMVARKGKEGYVSLSLIKYTKRNNIAYLKDKGIQTHYNKVDSQG